MSESYFHDKLKQELTDDDRESASVEFIKKSLNGTNSIVKIAVHDKEANIDDSIKLIDKNKRIIGKITVQVKTISKCNESKFEFQCPTSLFAYAEATDDVVILLAVDHKEKKVLWKHISRQLIYANREKASQDSILLHFNENERFDSKNAITTLEVWKSLFLDQHYLLTARTDSINSFIANLDTELIRLDPALIGEIQYYIDCREKIYRDLPLLKELLYPSVWKFGVAVFNYDPYNPNFMYGDINIEREEPGLLIRQYTLNEKRLANTSSLTLSFQNPFGNDDTVREEVKKKLVHEIGLFLNVRYLPNYEPIIAQFLIDCLPFGYNSEYENYTLSHISQMNYDGKNEQFVKSAISFLDNRGYVNVKDILDNNCLAQFLMGNQAFEKTNIEKDIRAYYEAFWGFMETNFPGVKINRIRNGLIKFIASNYYYTVIFYRGGISGLLVSYESSSEQPYELINRCWEKPEIIYNDERYILDSINTSSLPMVKTLYDLFQEHVKNALTNYSENFT